MFKFLTENNAKMNNTPQTVFRDKVPYSIHWRHTYVEQDYCCSISQIKFPQQYHFLQHKKLLLLLLPSLAKVDSAELFVDNPKCVSTCDLELSKSSKNES